MPYVPLHHLLPELARRETRTITVPEVGAPLPADDYALVESYCDEVGCDCRRVMLNVLSVAGGRVEAVIAFGWEDVAFYRRWSRDDDEEMVRHLKGPVLNLGSAETEHAAIVLAMVKELALSDPDYVDRLQRHYSAFRAKIEASAPARRGKKVGRNEPCPCDSGRKWKVCCGRLAGSADAAM
jgi:hypothetical protein